MTHWETTAFGILAAVGQVVNKATGVPGWVNLIGEVCSAVGVAGLGYSAASSRGVQRQIDAGCETPPNATAKPETKS